MNRPPPARERPRSVFREFWSFGWRYKAQVLSIGAIVLASGAVALFWR